MEESGKVALKFSMNCGIAVSVGTLCKINNQFCVIQLCSTVPSSLHCASVMKFWSYIQWHWLSRDSVSVNFAHTSVAEGISIGHITVATTIIELHNLVMFDGQ